MNHKLSSIAALRFAMAWLAGALALVALMAGCATERDLGLASARGGSCVGCHTSKDQLVATAEPDTGSVEEPGEG
jgi:mono/diheme cytochrome c family protein